MQSLLGNWPVVLLGMIALVSRTVAVFGDFDSVFPDLRPCPAACASRVMPDQWTVYHDTSRLTECDQPVLLDFAIHSVIDDPRTDVTIRACTAGNAKSNSNANINSYKTVTESRDNITCAAANQTNVRAQLAWWGSEPSGNSGDVVAATEQLKRFLSDVVYCDQQITFASVKGALVGIYAGAGVENHGTAATVIQRFIDHVKTNGVNTRMALEVCGEGSSSENILGIVAYTDSDFATVQRIVKSWSNADCVSGADDTKEFRNLTASARSLQPRANCRTTKVVSGDSCASLAQRCGISGADLTKYNTKAKFCGTLSPGQPVCCSSGTLPDIRPKPGADGTCATHKVSSSEYYDLIANKNGLKLTDLANMNDQTWGWTGCKNLQVGMNICVSKGKPPMPAAVPNAECGPTVAGTKPPTGKQKLADLNPCVLKACCNVWGQCGTTKDFCTISKSETGNPGTSAPRKNGCISSCGMDVVNNKEKPTRFLKVAYFEGWNMDRPCLRMDVRRIDKSYTHVHFSFAEITPQYQVLISPKVKPQFDAFKQLSGPKRVLAFGGWSFSTDHDTFPIFRESVTSTNRALFASRVVEFAMDNKLDGLDFDWEYPGAPDIPGIPPGGKNDGKNYLEFLKLVRGKLPKEMSLSVAAPASFWYLQGFPIADMAPVLDYIVYMTYDLYGQWDYGNKWANPGCPSGNCLRPHVNYTETYNSLAMITKADVPAKKVVVGIASYGRSFKMANSGCRGPMCKSLGTATVSPARKGICTNTSGYISNAEINKISQSGGAVQRWTDDTDTNYLIYDTTQWVAYMDDATKARRITKYKGLNFGGSFDWAVDLQSFLPNGAEPKPPPPGEGDAPLQPCNGKYASLDDISKNADKIPPHCAPIYVLPILKSLLEDSLKTYNDILKDGYDKKF